MKNVLPVLWPLVLDICFRNASGHVKCSHDLKMLFFRKNRINANRQQIFKINAFFERSAKSMYQNVFLEASKSTEILKNT